MPRIDRAVSVLDLSIIARPRQSSRCRTAKLQVYAGLPKSVCWCLIQAQLLFVCTSSGTASHGTRARNAQCQETGRNCGLARPVCITLKTLADFPNALTVDETGTTFAANAALKAGLQAAHLQRWVLGEDSGLCVDALDGAPGVYSARFSGPDATDAKNNELLMTKLAGIPAEKRMAYYVCSAALADPSGSIALPPKPAAMVSCALNRAVPAGLATIRTLKFASTTGHLRNSARRSKRC